MNRSILRCALVLALALGAHRATAQSVPEGFDDTFAVASLDPALLGEAEAVVRLDLLHFEVEHPGKAVKTVRRAVTVFGPDGRDVGELVIPYDPLHRLKKLSGVLRDARGKVIRKLKKDDQDDYSAIAGYSLYEDNRVRVARLYHDQYPYTVEYEYQMVYDGLINWPSWYPQESARPVAYTRFELEAPVDMEVRYAVENGTLTPAITQRGNRQVWLWEQAGLAAHMPEPHGPPWTKQALAVHTAPATFEVEGTQGAMDSWASFAQWYHALSEGRDTLPPDAVAEVRRLTDGLTDDREKARRLYAYLQAKTRYVSIQLGLGGWQPYEAAYVHERGYGDCKALTNYMRALLKAAGVPSFPALIKAGGQAPDVLADFPSNQFNHVVLYVPMAEEPLWLECTSQTMPFGHLGDFTEDRYALVVQPEGGELIRTPRSRAENNQQVRHATIRVLPDGSAKAKVDTKYSGNQQDHVRQALAHKSGREREAWLHERISLPTFTLRRADFSAVDARQTQVALPVELDVPNLAARTGTRLFLPVNLMDVWSFVPPPAEEERTQPVAFFSYAFSDIDTLQYILPDGFRVEAVPEPVRIEVPFGRYTAEVVVPDDGTLVFHRLLEITEPTLPAEQYPAFREFFRTVAHADRAQVVLVQE